MTYNGSGVDAIQVVGQRIACVNGPLEGFLSTLSLYYTHAFLMTKRNIIWKFIAAVLDLILLLQ